jgi:hypothetical protein
MYVINDVTLSNDETMLNKNIINCFDEEDLSAVDLNIIDDMVEKKVNDYSGEYNRRYKMNLKPIIKRSYTKNIYKIKP